MTAAIPPHPRGRPFRLSEALDAGLTASALRGRRFRRVFPTVYSCADLDDTIETRAAAALLLLPNGSVLSHHTAAALRRLPVPDSAEIHVLQVPGQRRPEISGITVHRLAYAESDVRRIRGFSVTTPERTWIDLASVLDHDDLVVLGDAVLHANYLDPVDLEATIAGAARRPGVSAARAALPWLEPRTESPGETWARLTLLRGGLPRPEANLDIFDPTGGWVARADLLYRDPPVAIQYDGAVHFTGIKRRRHDAARDELVRDLGYEVVVLTALDRPHPDWAVARVANARARATGRKPLGFVADRWPDLIAQHGPGSWLDSARED